MFRNSLNSLGVITYYIILFKPKRVQKLAKCPAFEIDADISIVSRKSRPCHEKVEKQCHMYSLYLEIKLLSSKHLCMASLMDCVNHRQLEEL